MFRSLMVLRLSQGIPQVQATAPIAPVAEYAASDRYWQGKASIRPDILVLDDGATIRIRGGHLEVFSRVYAAEQ